MVPKLKKHTLPVEGSVDSKKLEFHGSECCFVLFTEPVTEPFVLLNGPVKNALFCLMDRYQNVCVWFMARNRRVPKVGTHACQRGNHRLPLQRTAGSHRLEVMGNQRLPLQATAGSQRLELMLPNLGTIGYHCKELPVPKGWN